MNKPITVLLAIALWGLASAGSEKQTGAAPKMEHPGKQHLVKRLDLSDEQMEKIKEQKLQTHKEQIELRGKMEIADLELRHELGKKKLEKDKIDKLIDKLSESHKQQLKLRIESLIKMRSVLTEEQLEKFMELADDGNIFDFGPGPGDLRRKLKNPEHQDERPPIEP